VRLSYDQTRCWHRWLGCLALRQQHLPHYPPRRPAPRLAQAALGQTARRQRAAAVVPPCCPAWAAAPAQR